MRKFVEYRAAEGRPLSATQLLLARRYAELSALSQDLYNAVLLQPSVDRHHAKYISTVRAQALLASLLGESVASAGMARRFQVSSNGQSLAVQLARYQLEPHDDEDNEEAG